MEKDDASIGERCLEGEKLSKVHNQTFDPSSSIYLQLPPKDPNKSRARKNKIFIFDVFHRCISLDTWFEFNVLKVWIPRDFENQSIFLRTFTKYCASCHSCKCLYGLECLHLGYFLNRVNKSSHINCISLLQIAQDCSLTGTKTI